jgi:hypothetical protein
MLLLTKKKAGRLSLLSAAALLFIFLPKSGARWLTRKIDHKAADFFIPLLNAMLLFARSAWTSSLKSLLAACVWHDLRYFTETAGSANLLMQCAFP